MLLPFKAHHLQVGGRHYIILPKLNKEQTGIMVGRLAREGFSVRQGSSITAASSKCVIHVEPLGLCWSSSDPSDYILPSIPEILGCKKEATTVGALLGMYFATFSVHGSSIVRVSPRLESLGNWDGLRSSGGCGLAPDEHMVAQLVLGGARGSCSVITDFADAGSIPFYSGGRLYFRSRLPVRRASETLRVVGSAKRENSYLPRDGILRLPGLVLDRRTLLAGVEGLGDWCAFVASQRQSSNGRLDWPRAAPVV